MNTIERGSTPFFPSAFYIYGCVYLFDGTLPGTEDGKYFSANDKNRQMVTVQETLTKASE